MVSVFPCFPYMVSVFPCLPYKVVLLIHLNVKATVLIRALPWMLHCPKGRYCNVTMIRPLLLHGICVDLSGSPSVAIVDCQSICYLLDLKVICCLFPWNNSIYICRIWGDCRSGIVLGLFNKCSGLQPSDTIWSCWLGRCRHAHTGKQLFVKSYHLSFQSVTVVISTYVCLYWIKGILWGRWLPSGCLSDRIK